MTCKQSLGFLALAIAAPAAILAQPSALVASGAVTVPFAFEGKRIPVWGGDAILVADGPLASPGNFLGFNHDGRQVFQAGFSIPGASNTAVDGFARGADGTLALCGRSYASDGRGAPFIAWIAADGNSQQVIRTAPYHARVIAVAPDGTLWTVGKELNADGSEKSGVNPEAGVVRHFDRSGKSLGAFIPRSSIPDPTHLTNQQSLLAASADRAGWLHYDHSNRGAYVEISPDGSITTYPIPQIQAKGMRLGGIAFTASGDVFAEVDDLNGSSNFSLFALNRSAGQWLPVSIPATGRWALLLGASGNELALTYGPGSSYSTIHFFVPGK